MTKQIQLVQIPVITHMLAQIGQNVTERLDALNIDAQVATVDTVKSLKELRADLNKELADFEEQRKFIKNGVLTPYNEFETLYKAEVSDKYSNAIIKLKDKIAVVETQIKDEKKANLKLYFDELCQSEKIDFLTFEHLKLEINLSTTEKAYKEQINTFVSKVVDDLSLIDTNLFKAEIMVEYKVSLNVAKAIKDVTERKEKEQIELQRLQVIENNRRIDACKRLGMTFMDMTNAYEYDAEIYITSDQLKTLAKDEFNTKMIEFHEAIKAKKQATVQPETVSQPVVAPVTPSVSSPLSAPVVEKPEEQVTASFQVSGTMPQLRALGQYMKDNHITYKNI